jgi:hypothetical protein
VPSFQEEHEKKRIRVCSLIRFYLSYRQVLAPILDENRPFFAGIGKI